MRPFLKWVGGKYRIITTITAQLPSGNRLIEPFVGSGAVFLNTNYNNYLLADSNLQLINTFQYLSTKQEKFISYCQKFFTPATNQEAVFLAHRETFNTTDNHLLQAALFIYLNRHAYNGLMRYNSKGLFNAPFGQYDKPYFPATEMRQFIEKAQTAKFCHDDFLTTMDKAKAGDIVYCDPPYVPLSCTARFIEYGKGTFKFAQQQALADMARQLTKRQVRVVISNHDTPELRQLYHGATIHNFSVQRYISCNAGKRNKANELLAVF